MGKKNMSIKATTLDLYDRSPDPLLSFGFLLVVAMLGIGIWAITYGAHKREPAAPEQIRMAITECPNIQHDIQNATQLITNQSLEKMIKECQSKEAAR